MVCYSLSYHQLTGKCFPSSDHAALARIASLLSSLWPEVVSYRVLHCHFLLILARWPLVLIQIICICSMLAGGTPASRIFLLINQAVLRLGAFGIVIVIFQVVSFRTAVIL